MTVLIHNKIIFFTSIYILGKLKIFERVGKINAIKIVVSFSIFKLTSKINNKNKKVKVNMKKIKVYKKCYL
jgi:hypothetical protein